MYPQVNLIKFDCDQANYWLRAQNTGWKYSKLVLRNTWYLAKEVTQKRAQSFPFLVTVKWTGSWCETTYKIRTRQNSQEKRPGRKQREERASRTNHLSLSLSLNSLSLCVCTHTHAPQTQLQTLSLSLSLSLSLPLVSLSSASYFSIVIFLLLSLNNWARKRERNGERDTNKEGGKKQQKINKLVTHGELLRFSCEISNPCDQYSTFKSRYFDKTQKK